MPSIKEQLEQAELFLKAWRDAELAVASAQSYSISGRSLTRANLSEIRQQINYWETKVRDLNRKQLGLKPRRKIFGTIPIDS
ncbi:DUF6148 family protein [Bacillus infantis]|jgi:Family of unknown function (DUF6148)|uniref:DUF6148 family protein n=1 Tax=Bacillus infantis TaxID=324767 RepID=UPI00321AB1F8